MEPNIGAASQSSGRALTCYSCCRLIWGYMIFLFFILILTVGFFSAAAAISTGAAPAVPAHPPSDSGALHPDSPRTRSP